MNLYKFSYRIKNGLGGHGSDEAMVVAKSWDAAYRYMQNEYPEADVHEAKLLAKGVNIADGY